MGEVLTTGNTAKLYCLDLLHREIAARDGDRYRIVDLGCGTGETSLALLREFPQVEYVGVEPSAAACAVAEQKLRGLRATIVHALAYDIDVEPADAVVSFSVLEHVYRR